MGQNDDKSKQGETDEEREAREEREREEAERQEEIDKDLSKLKADRDRWKRESQRWQQRAQSNFEKAKKYDEMDAKSKTDTERLAAAEQDAKETKRELIRARVALRKGLTEAQAKRLIGESEEDMETDADELLTTFRSSSSEDEGDNGNKINQKRPLERLTRMTTPRSGAAGSTKEPLPSREEISAIVDRSMENR